MKTSSKMHSFLVNFLRILYYVIFQALKTKQKYIYISKNITVSFRHEKMKYFSVYKYKEVILSAAF